ncbi:MAG: cyclic nucleotide-binding domain-containing protein [Chloroflexota bacterium]
MRVERARAIPLFKEIHLFSGMDEAQLSRAAGFFKEVVYQPGQLICEQGGPADAFYIIQQGDVIFSTRLKNEDRQLDMLTTGDYFGEEGLILHRPRAATARANGEVTLLVSEKQAFHKLLAEFPHVGNYLNWIIYSRQFIRRYPFSWLNENETVYQVRRKHPAYLLLTLVLPFLLLLLGGLIVTFTLWAVLTGPLQTGALIVGSLLAFSAAAWGLWNWIDWGNDYYIVTNQRVVWIERVLWLYESQVEAPLDQVRGTKILTSLVGRWLGYGDIVVTTYTGEVPLRLVSDPYQMDAVIREFWRRHQRLAVEAQKSETEREVLKILKREPSGPPPPLAAAAASRRQTRRQETRPGEAEELGFGERYFGNWFRMRTEVGDVITYRKHWLVLLGKTLRPGVVLLTLFGLFVVSLVLYFNGSLAADMLAVIDGLSLVVSIPVFVWWMYNYLDWSNDIYQITKDSIYDIERKPLGTENRTSAPLDRVISLNHERRGFIGYLFNFGNVMVNVGDAKLTFDGVYQPARVQQDIFRRMQQLQLQKQKAEIARERDRILNLLEIYHDKVYEDDGDDVEG